MLNSPGPDRVLTSQTSDVIVADLCIEALGWACRLLPFCRFLNAEEALQDLVLSLVAELPPSHVVIFIYFTFGTLTP